MRTILVVALLAIGCGGPTNRGNDAGVDSAPGKMDACIGLECRQVDCASMGMPDTTVSGTVYAPNETLALFGVTVYVPNLAPGPFLEGVKCDQCDPELPGQPIVRTISDEAGKFSLPKVPVGTDIPLIITIGKWRRTVTIPNVVQCQDNPLPANLTRLPRNKNEGDLPHIAIATGGCDALECLVRKLGVSDNEFTNDAGNGRVHLFSSGGASSIQAGGAALADATTLWGNLDKMKQYDLQLYSCECSPDFSDKPQASLDNVRAYADAGGRLFMSHYHHVWLEGDAGHTTPWSNIATCQSDTLADGTDIIDQDVMHNPKGMSFAQWMVNVQGSSVLGQVAITEGKETCSAVDATKAERWVYTQATNAPQNFQFTTPQELEPKDRCGKVVFSDMHVASGSSSSGAFPSGCAAANSPLSPQEKALAFMFFDIASCVGQISHE